LQSGLLDVYKYGYSDARQQILKLQEKQKNFARINDLQVPLEEATALAQELINNQSFQAIGQLSDDILNQAKQVMISGIQQGKSENWLVMELNGLFAPYTNGVVMAGGAFSPYLVNTIVRTLSTNIFNQARKDVANDPKLEGFVKMYEYSAIMDARTTEVCTMLDGKIYPIESPVWVNITPPNHFNCRSVLVYVTEADIAIDGVQPSEMISLDKLKEDKSTEGFIL
jgi:SPP1 gp7 family putative phage head morphogenesis protein